MNFKLKLLFLFSVFFAKPHFACSPVFVKTFYKIDNGKIVYGDIRGDKPFEIIRNTEADLTNFRSVLKNTTNTFNKKENHWLDDEYFQNENPHYFTDDRFIFYKGLPLNNSKDKLPVDVKSFKTFPGLPASFAVDDHYIYYDGVAVEENTGAKKVDASTLKIVNEFLISDQHNLYHEGKYVGQNTDLQLFGERGVMSDDTSCAYAIGNTINTTTENVFVNGVPINADPKTFAVKRWIVYAVLTYTDKTGEHHYTFGQGKYRPDPKKEYFISSNYYQTYDKIFYKWYDSNYKERSTNLPGANPEKFAFLNDRISYDDHHIYILKLDEDKDDLNLSVKPVYGKLVLLHNDLAKDGRYVYLVTDQQLVILPNVDPKNLKLIQEGVYTEGKTLFSYNRFRDEERDKLQLVNDLDQATFKILNENFAVDKNRVYLIKSEEFEVNPDEEANSYIALHSPNLLQTKNGFYLKSYSEFDILATIGKATVLENDYIVDEKKVWQYLSYGFKEIKEADVATFQRVNETFSKDADHVFYNDKIINKADPLTFEYLKYHYSRDKNYIFQEDRILEGADKKSFEVLAPKYSKDKTNVWRYVQKIPDANPATFQFLNKYETAKDDRNIFVYGNLLKEADYATFKIVDKNLSRDKNHIYWFNTVLELDLKSFQYAGCNYLKDKNGAYWLSEYGLRNIENADPQTFILVGCDESVAIAKDDISYYSNGNREREIDVPEKFKKTNDE